MLQKQAESNRPDLRKPMHCIALRITSNKLVFKTSKIRTCWVTPQEDPILGLYNPRIILVKLRDPYSQIPR